MKLARVCSVAGALAIVAVIAVACAVALESSARPGALVSEPFQKKDANHLIRKAVRAAVSSAEASARADVKADVTGAVESAITATISAGSKLTGVAAARQAADKTVAASPQVCG